MKVIIIYTMPWGEHCSMRWLHEELSKKYDCEIVAPSEDWCLFGDESAKGKIARNVWFFGLAVRAVCKAKPGDIIVSSPRNIGLFTLALARGGVTVVSLGWYTPSRSEFFYRCACKALERDNFWAGVNSPTTKIQFGEVYGVEDLSRVFWIPDIPWTGVPEFREKRPSDRRYCFTGGVNNRDWPLVVKAAHRRENLAFECVATFDDWAAKTDSLEIPRNVTARSWTDEYDELLSGAHCMLLPLYDDRVAGLTDIIKAICMGVIPVVSRNAAMEQYLPEDLRDTLQFEVGDVADMLVKLDAVWELDEEEYAAIVGRLQARMAANFTSKQATACIEEVIQKAAAQPVDAMTVS